MKTGVRRFSIAAAAAAVLLLLVGAAKEFGVSSVFVTAQSRDVNRDPSAATANNEFDAAKTMPGITATASWQVLFRSPPSR